MIFGNGCWLQKEGCGCFSPQEVYFEKVEPTKVTLCLPTAKIVTRGSTLGGINHQEQLHQVVRVGERALHQEHIAAADALFIAYFKFAVGKAGYSEVAQRTSEFLTNLFGQVTRCGTRKNHEVVVVHLFGCVWGVIT